MTTAELQKAMSTPISHHDNQAAKKAALDQTPRLIAVHSIGYAGQNFGHMISGATE